MPSVAVADIGGTNCRLAVFDTIPSLALRKVHIVPTSTVTDTDALWDMMQPLCGSEKPCACCVALAGPVVSGSGQLTNGRLRLEQQRLAMRSGVPCVLCNDFTAQAHACVTAAGRTASRIIGATCAAPDGACRGVIGAGTGLGMAALAAERGPDRGHQWRALPSEGGHAAFPLMGEEEFAFARYACSILRTEFVTAEQVLCGQGLSLLHAFLAGEHLTPPEVGQIALQRESETLTWYARFYGRACRNWLLASLCLGGLWVAGGIAASNPLCVTHQAFADAWLAPGKGQIIAAQTPVYLMTDCLSGLWGAASIASMQCQL